MSGMNVATGEALDDLPHIRQSVRDILTTPIGSRVMRREYGSLIPELIDQPANEATRLRLAAATYAALLRHEPRIVLTRADVGLPTAAGGCTVTLEAMRRSGPVAGQSINLTVGLG